MTWLQYHQIHHAIPKSWINILGQDSGEPLSEPSMYTYLERQVNKKTSYVYNRLVNTCRLATNSYHKIVQHVSVTEEEYYVAFRYIKKLTNVTLYRNFQFRFLHGIIYTNNILYYWKKVPSQHCEYCHDCSKQTVFHLFFECKTIKEFWEALEEFVLKDL